MIHRPSIIAPRCRTCGGFTRDWLRLNRRRAGFASWLHGACQCCNRQFWRLSPCLFGGATNLPVYFFWLSDVPEFDGWSQGSPPDSTALYNFGGKCFRLQLVTAVGGIPKDSDGNVIPAENELSSGQVATILYDALCCRCMETIGIGVNQDDLQPIPRYALVDISGAIHCCTMRIRNGPPQYFKGVGDPLNSSFLLEYQPSGLWCQWGAIFPFTYEVHGNSSCSNDPPFVFENAATLAVTLRLLPHLNSSGLDLTAVVFIPSNDINTHIAFVTQQSGGPTPTHPFVGWGDAYSINNGWGAGVPCGYDTTSGLDPNFVFTIFSRLGTAAITFGN